MKKILFIAIICMASIQIQAQGIQDIISFDKFEVWAGQIEIEEMEVNKIEQSDDVLYIGSMLYTVDFKNEEEFLRISLMDVRNFVPYLNMNPEDFYQDGFRMLYLTSNDDVNYSILGITNSDINSFVMLYFMPVLSKEEMISLFENIHIDNLFK